MHRLAYSCMMIMTRGFGQIFYDSIDSNLTLQELTSGQLLSRYTLSISMTQDSQVLKALLCLIRTVMLKPGKLPIYLFSFSNH